MQASRPWSRREFLARAGLFSSALALAASSELPSRALEGDMPPVAVFSKIYQELNLDFVQTAELTALAGLDGIDCPVRPGGQVLPARVADDLPRLASVLKEHKARLLLLTTSIQSIASPGAEAILRTAQALGVKYYRLGYWKYKPGKSPQATLQEIKAQLKDLAAVNKELGTCALLQNHAGADLVGAKVTDFYEIASEFSPEQVAIAFDIGHALNELPDTWKGEFDRLQSHFRVAYVKDWKRGTGFVPFGEGQIAATDFFKLFKAAPTRAPISMHTEYEWAGESHERTKAALAAALRRDLGVVKGWWDAA